MDVLSTVLQTVRLEGALFFNADFSAPWRVRTPDSCVIAPHLSAEPRHVITYHLVTCGQAYAELEDGARLELSPGDIVVFPHGDPHFLGNGSTREVRDHERVLQQVMAQGLNLARYGGGGETTRFVCGYLLCDRQVSQGFLSGLPAMFKVNVCDRTGGWLENSIRYSVEQALAAAAGSGIVVAKLSEALFAETLRRYIESLPPEQTGWLAGARDPEVGKALAEMHRRPAEPWTIARLARQVGVSRSVLAERFRHFLGIPPMAYLSRSRMQLGAQLLVSSTHTVAQIAAQVGYESEAAFNRAFKRAFGAPPARFRLQARAATSGA
jgi:AraC-like DNA-binding protein